MASIPIWSTVDRFYFENERVISVPGSPHCDIRFEKNPERMTLLIDQAADIGDAFSKLKNIRVFEQSNADGICIACDDDALFEFFYMAVVSIVTDLQSNGFSAPDAITRALGKLESLIEQSVDQDYGNIAVGLWGELHFLRSLVTEKGVSSVDAWFGPDKESHDFRYETLEVEVKTTKNESRKHAISNFTQLQPSDGKQLFLCSIPIVRNAGGRSLVELNGEVRSLLENSAEALQHYDDLIDAFKLVLSSDYARIKYDLRLPVQFYVVDDNFPRITRERLDAMSGGDSSAIVDGKYTVEISEGREAIALDAFLGMDAL